MPTNLIVLIASLLITWLALEWTAKIIKTCVTSAFLIILVVVVLQITLGISPQQLWDQILSFPKIIQEFINK